VRVKWFAGKTYDAAAGRESRSAFIAQAAFWFSAFKFLTSGVTVKVGSHQVSLGTTDATLLGAFLAPCLALYWGRRAYGLLGETKEPESPAKAKEAQ
jgi:hypothetical protein